MAKFQIEFDSAKEMAEALELMNGTSVADGPPSVFIRNEMAGALRISALPHPDDPEAIVVVLSPRAPQQHAPEGSVNLPVDETMRIS